jgi:DNA-binding NtrC family response regulator
VASILLVDDDADFSALLAEALGRHGHEVRWVDGAEPALELLTPGRPDGPDLALLDHCLPRMHGLELLEELRRRGAHLPVLLLTGRGTADVAIRAAKLGAFRYLPKPDDLDRSLARLLESVGEAAEVARLSGDPVRLPGDGGPGEALLGQSDRMCAVYEQIGLAARADGPVLIVGETGTGKELVARALFQHSGRSGRPLLRINCSAFDEAGLDDELFGYEAGAYPEAGRPLAGLLEQADGGGVLLDHVSHLGRPTQARLLRLLQEGVVQRGGRGARPLPVDVRVLACSAAGLPPDGPLGPELHFLLARSAIHLPPLRERGDDVLLLADHFLANSAADLGRPARSFHPRARAKLRGHAWPGNVRELQVVVHQAVLTCRRAEVGPDEVRLGAPPSLRPAREEEGAEARRLPPSREKAYQLFRWALEQSPDLADRSDAEVFDWLQRDPRVEGEGLPDRSDTFERYLREARTHYDDHKHLPRAGRPLGRSTVRPHQV